MTDPRMTPTLVRKSSLHVPQYATMVNLQSLNSDRDIALQDPAAYVSGHSSRSEELGIPASLFQQLKNAAPAIQASTDPAMQHDLLEKFAGVELPENIFEILAGEATPQQTSIRDLVKDPHVIESLAMDIVETRVARFHESTTRIDELDSVTCQEMARQLGFKEVSYMESFPLLMAVAGYKRFPGKQDSKLILFKGDDARHHIYVEAFETEALLFTLEPERVLRIVQEYLPDYKPRDDLPLEIQLGAAAAAFFDEHKFADDVPPSVGHVVWSLMHTVSHATMRAMAEPSGFSLNSLSEYMLPATLTFAVYVNRSQETGIGGLESVFTDSLQPFLASLPSLLRDCVHDPVCWDQERSRCHACLLISETSCRAYNAHLNRRLVCGDDDHEGYWP